MSNLQLVKRAFAEGYEKQQMNVPRHLIPDIMGKVTALGAMRNHVESAGAGYSTFVPNMHNRVDQAIRATRHARNASGSHLEGLNAGLAHLNESTTNDMGPRIETFKRHVDGIHASNPNHPTTASALSYLDQMGSPYPHHMQLKEDHPLSGPRTPHESPFTTVGLPAADLSQSDFNTRVAGGANQLATVPYHETLGNIASKPSFAQMRPDEKLTTSGLRQIYEQLRHGPRANTADAELALAEVSALRNAETFHGSGNNHRYQAGLEKGVPRDQFDPALPALRTQAEASRAAYEASRAAQDKAFRDELAQKNMWDKIDSYIPRGPSGPAHAYQRA